MHEPKKILFVKLCCIGDVLKTTPVIEAIKRQFPKSHITYLISRWALDVIRTNPNVNDYIIFDGPFERSPFRKVSSSITTMRRLRDFDIALIFHRTPLAAFFAYASGIKHRVGFIDSRKNPFLTHTVPFDTKKHEVDRFLDLLSILGIKTNDRIPRMYVPQEEKNKSEELLLSVGLSEKDYVAIHPGGGQNPGKYTPIKIWLPERFAELANVIVGDFRKKVLFVGGMDDKKVFENVKSYLKVKTYNLIGRTSFLELAGVLQESELFVGSDSGPLYIAEAVGTKTVSIFGPTDPRLVAPRGKDHRVIWKPPPCAPCYTPKTAHQDFSKCPIGTHECIKSIDIEEVLSAISDLLENSHAQRAEELK